MKRFSIVALAAIMMAAGIWGAASAQASDPQGGLDGRTCRVKTLRGSYLFAASGFNIVGGAAQPKAINEVIDFAGDGTLEVPAVTVSINGAINHPPGSVGDYTLLENCRGTLVFNGGPSFDIVAAADGSTVWMIQSNPNTVFEGTATRFK